MTNHSTDVCLLNELAHEFTQRMRQGEHPSLEEYVQRYPQLADDFREVFPTLALIEPLDVATPCEMAQGTPEPDFAAKRVGDYRILREVGRGGMGVVFEAIQEPLGRRVALKVLPASSVRSAARLERFHREARAAANLHHTNIVPVHDMGEADGWYFYAMQFIDGRPLTALSEDTGQATAPFTQSVARWQAAQQTAITGLAMGPDQEGLQSERTETDTANQRRPASSSARPMGSHNSSSCLEMSSPANRSGMPRAHYRQIASIAKQVAVALAYAHGEGVIHRDIKPSNLLLDRHGTVWITDFGLAKVTGQDDLTSDGDVVGTLRYLAPERFEGHVDERGDIYSLGVTLFEVLTGRPPFAANTRAEVVDQILHGRITRPRRFDPLIPRDLETIVLKAMSHDPSHRYVRADLLADDLDRFINDLPIAARRQSAFALTWRWCRRNRALAGTIALAAVLFVAIWILSLVDSVRIRDQLHETQVARREARVRLFDSLVSQAHARWMGGERFGRRFESLAAVREATTLARKLQLPETEFRRLRDEAIAALCLPDEEVNQLVDAYPVGSTMVDFDPDIQRYARGDIEGNVTIHRVADNQVLHRLPSPGTDFELTLWDGVVFSPNGVYLQHRCRNSDGERSHLRLWDLSGAQPQLVRELSEKIVGLTAFAPDGRHLGLVVRHTGALESNADLVVNQVHVLDLASGQDVVLPIEADETTRLVFHPSKPQLAISDVAGVRIVRWENGTEIGRWARPHTTPLAWSSDGRMLLARSDGDSLIHRWDVKRRQELSPWNGGHKNQIDRIVFNHRGDRFISTSLFRYQLWDFPSGQLLWDSPQGALMGIRFSRDDDLLAGVHGVYPTVRLLRVASGLELRRVELASPTDHGFPKAVLDSDGRILAATSQAGTVLLDLQTYEQLAVIPGVRIPIAFQADGALLTHSDAPEGVVRWPIVVNDAAPLRLSLGPTESLAVRQDESEQSLFGGLENWSASRDGRVIATPWQRDGRGAGANIFMANKEGALQGYRRMELGPQHDVRSTSVSPNGKWVATGSVSWMAERGEALDTVTIWNAATGARVKDLMIGEGCPQFSPDGQWIAVTSSGFPEGVRTWRVDTWSPAPAPSQVKGPGLGSVAFDAESRMMAVQGYRIRLLVPETGRELAWLSVPEETSLAPQCFTPDGSRLIAYGVKNGTLYAWDLRSIREQLEKLGLDWGDPPAPGN